MVERFPCPQSGELCTTPGLCGIVNVPLQGVIRVVREGLGGAGSEPLIRSKLTQELSSYSERHGVSIYPTADYRGNINVCPAEALVSDRKPIEKPRDTAARYAEYAKQAIQHTIEDLPHFRG